MSDIPRTDTHEISRIRSKLLGALLADARSTAGQTLGECAATLELSETDYAAFESGQTSPTLPQLEVLAYLFKLPLQHFWGGQTVAATRDEDKVKANVAQFTALRDRVIGASLRAARDEAGLSLEELAGQTRLSAERLATFEQGTQPTPLHELQIVAPALNLSIDDLVDTHGSIGGWLRRQSEFSQFSDLPDELRAFMLKPVNRSYLDLAMRLSGLSVERLRGIAEGILDITY